MKQNLINMLKMQDAMNTKVHSDWRSKNLEWYRAIWIESAELMDHYGWKWWKKQDTDREQVILELVDIWHFGLSIVLMSGKTLEDCARSLEKGLAAAAECGDFKEDVEDFAQQTLISKNFDITGFSKLLKGTDLSFDGLYRRYVGKNVLNFFRQDHGYKEGNYRKIWAGKEDNEHLVELLNQIDTDSPDLQAALYEALSLRYENT